MPTSELTQIFDSLLAWLQRPHTPWQLTVIGAALAAGALAVRLLRPWLEAADRRWQAGGSWLRRLALPAVVLAVLLAGRAILAQWQPTHLVNVAVALAWALVIVRAIVHVLRYAFGTRTWVASFERAISATAWVIVALHISGFLPDVMQLLDDADVTLGKSRLSLLMVLQGTAGIAAATVIALWVARLLENRISGDGRLESSAQVILSKLVRPLLVLVAILIALPAVGIDLTALSVFGGALGVGLGFGLQKVASNYVSGFIIVLDRSVRIGDVVTVDNRTGQVTQMTARYVVLRSADGTESLVPNETIISSTVVNQSWSARQVRGTVAVQVPYSADLEAVLALLTELAQAHPRVLAEPAPMAVIKGFAESGVSVELHYWIGDPEKGRLDVASDLHLAVARAFRDRGIEFPFPRRDVQLLGTPGDRPSA